jgi:hypothetical protein
MKARLITKLAGCMALGIVLIGCDRQSKSPVASAPAAAAPQTQPEPTKPTTQELMEGSYKKMVLPGMPLSLEVPQSWKIENEGPLMFLQGPTPADNSMIQLAQRESLRPDQIENLLNGVNHDRDQHPQSVKRAEMHDFGTMRVLEQLSVGQPVTSPKVDSRGEGILDEHGTLMTVTITPMHWKLTIFVPAEKLFSQYELNFIDLSQEQYNVDKDFLEKIVHSLKYQTTGAPSTAP